MQRALIPLGFLYSLATLTACSGGKLVGGACSRTSDCDAGLACLNKQCAHPACRSNDDCQADQICTDVACEFSGGARLKITGVTGDTESGLVRKGLRISGESLANTKAVRFVAKATGQIFDLVISSAEASTVTADFDPSFSGELINGALSGSIQVVTADVGAQTVEVSILRGEQGPPGASADTALKCAGRGVAVNYSSEGSHLSCANDEAGDAGWSQLTVKGFTDDARTTPVEPPTDFSGTLVATGGGRPAASLFGSNVAALWVQAQTSIANATAVAIKVASGIISFSNSAGVKERFYDGGTSDRYESGIQYGTKYERIPKSGNNYFAWFGGGAHVDGTANTVPAAGTDGEVLMKLSGSGQLTVPKGVVSGNNQALGYLLSGSVGVYGIGLAGGTAIRAEAGEGATALEVMGKVRLPIVRVRQNNTPFLLGSGSRTSVRVSCPVGYVALSGSCFSDPTQGQIVMTYTTADELQHRDWTCGWRNDGGSPISNYSASAVATCLLTDTDVTP